MRSLRLVGIVAAILLVSTGITVVAVPSALAAGSWAQATEVAAPTNAASNPVGLLGPISCSSAGNCTAAGGYEDNSGNSQQAMVATETSGTWAQATQVAAPTNAVSIVPSDPHAEFLGDLVLVGGQLHRRRHLRRHPPAGHGGHRDLGDLGASDRSRRPDQAGSDLGAALEGISCSSAGSCTAVGTYQDSSGEAEAMVATEASGTWAQASELAFPANGSSPNSLGSRVRRRGTAPPSGATPTVPGRPGHHGHRDLGDLGAGDRIAAPTNAGIDSDAYLVAISCTSAGNCTAAGHYSPTSQAMVATETSGTWAQATEVALPHPRGRHPRRRALGYLVFLGGKLHGRRELRRHLRKRPCHGRHRDLGDLGSGERARPPDHTGSNPSAYLGGISCSSAGSCTAAGTYENTSDRITQAMVATESGTAVTANPTVTVTDNSQGLAEGGDLTFTAKITGSGSTPTGTVSWGLSGPGSPTYADSTLDSSGTATCTVSDAQAGDYSVTATYSGDTNYRSAEGTDTATVGSQPPPPPVTSPSTTNGTLTPPVVGMAPLPDGKGYWLADAAGAVSPHGNAVFYGSMAGQHLNAPIAHIVATPDGMGYWLVAADGGTFAFGDAGFYGSMGGKHLNAPVVDMAPTPDGKGYWLVASDGGIFAFGDAGSTARWAATTSTGRSWGWPPTPDGGLLAGCVRRRDLRLRRRRSSAPPATWHSERSGHRHGRRRPTARLLVRGLRRRDLRLRRRRLPRFGRRHRAQPPDRRHGRRRRNRGLLAGRRGRRHLCTTHRSTAPTRV